MVNTLPPAVGSPLAQPVVSNGFCALQSAKLAVGVASANVTFTCFPLCPANKPLVYKIINSGAGGCYIAGSNSASAVAAVASGSTPTPTANAAIANCDYIPASMTAPMYMAFPGNVDTIAAIRASADTTLEISIGYMV